MKRLLFLPLLALPLLFLGCDGQAPTDPSADASTPLFAKATAPLGVGVTCPTCTGVSGINYYTFFAARTFGWDACPATKGALQLYICKIRGTFNYGTAEQCNTGAGEWTWNPMNRKVFKWVLTEGYCDEPSMLIATGTSSGIGYMLTYKPRGSGFYPETVYFNVFSTTL